MSNTYTQIHIQCIFAVKYRDAVINRSWKERLHKYIIAIVNNNGHKALAINSMPDHLHLFFGMRPKQSLSDLMQLVKRDSSEWINKQKIFTKRLCLRHIQLCVTSVNKQKYIKSFRGCLKFVKCNTQMSL